MKGREWTNNRQVLKFQGKHPVISVPLVLVQLSAESIKHTNSR